MALAFKHLPKGSVVGTGNYVFRHFGEEGSPEPPVLLSWEHVLWSIENNSYNTDYSIGDLIPLDLGTEGNINMQIAGFDVDDLADGTGKAHISFISKELLNTEHRMNPNIFPSSAPYDEGTGAIGGWEKSEIRAYFKNIVKPLIPKSVNAAIVDVIKKHISFNTSGSSEEQMTMDNIWMPTFDEINGSSAIYGTLFYDNESRKKMKAGAELSQKWWTRNAYVLDTYFETVQASGRKSYNNAIDVYGVCIGFCL